jgi:hypothetical protein
VNNGIRATPASGSRTDTDLISHREVTRHIHRRHDLLDEAPSDASGPPGITN